jgi:hypothetical protein
MLAWQVDGRTRERQLDAVEQKIRKRNLLAEYRAVNAVFAGQCRGAIRPDAETPDLKPLSADGRDALRQRDLVEQPIGAAGIGDVPGAVGEEDAAHKAVAVPVFAASELAEVGVGAERRFDVAFLGEMDRHSGSLGKVGTAAGLEPASSPSIHWGCEPSSDVENGVLCPLSYAAISVSSRRTTRR